MHVDLDLSCVPSLACTGMLPIAQQNTSGWQEAANATCISSEAGLITPGVLLRMQIMQAVQNLTSKQAISGMAPALSAPQVAQRQRVSTTTRAAKNPLKAPFKSKVCMHSELMLPLCIPACCDWSAAWQVLNCRCVCLCHQCAVPVLYVSQDPHQLKATVKLVSLRYLQAEYDGNAYQTNPIQSAFTRRREIFVGACASAPPVKSSAQTLCCCFHT